MKFNLGDLVSFVSGDHGLGYISGLPEWASPEHSVVYVRWFRLCGRFQIRPQCLEQVDELRLLVKAKNESARI